MLKSIVVLAVLSDGAIHQVLLSKDESDAIGGLLETWHDGATKIMPTPLQGIEATATLNR